LHGQATWLAAEHLNTHAPGLESADGDVWVSGELKQAALFGENLSLHRTIRSSVGSRSFRITDVVTNNAPTEARHMLLYHFNLGWPLIDTATEISAPTRAVIAQNDASHRAIDEWASVPAPRTGEPQHVIGHTLDADAPVVVAVENAELGLRVELSFHTSSLPELYMWRFFSDAAYVLGVEPASCAADAVKGSPSPRLAARQSVEYHVDVSVDVL
jgi:hypothetical protein